MNIEPEDEAYGAVLRALLSAFPEGVFRLSHWTDIHGGEHWHAGHEVGHMVGRRTRYDRRLGEGDTPLAAMRALLTEAER